MSAAPVVANNAANVKASAAQVFASVEAYQNKARALNEVLGSQTAIQGAVQGALTSKGDEFMQSVNRTIDRVSPRVQAVSDSADSTAGVAEEGAGALGGVDITV